MNIQNGIIQDSNIGGVPFTPMIVTPKGKRNVRTLKQLLTSDHDPEYIVVHNTGNAASTANDAAHSRWLQNVENADVQYVSVHMFVDKDSCVQTCPLNEVTYNAGDGGSGKGNARSLSIEICENDDYPAAESNGIKLVVAFMKQFNIPIDRVQPHRYFASNKKLCPHRILKSQATWESDWKKFQQRIMAVYNNDSSGQNPAPDPGSDTYTVQKGDSLWRIAQNVLGGGSRYTEIASLNGISSPYIIHVGQVLQLPQSSSSSGSGSIKVGDRVKITGTYYATGQRIPTWVKETTHTVYQLKSDRALMKEIMSWVYLSDIYKV